MAASMPRKFPHAGKAAGWRKANAAEMITVARACMRQMAVTARAVRYVGPLVADTEVTGSVSEVARGK